MTQSTVCMFRSRGRVRLYTRHCPKKLSKARHLHSDRKNRTSALGRRLFHISQTTIQPIVKQLTKLRILFPGVLFLCILLLFLACLVDERYLIAQFTQLFALSQ